MISYDDLEKSRDVFGEGCLFFYEVFVVVFNDEEVDDGFGVGVGFVDGGVAGNILVRRGVAFSGEGLELSAKEPAANEQ